MANENFTDPLSRAILQTAVDPIIVIDESGNIEHANPATTLLLGHALEDMVGQNISMLMPEPFRSEHDGHLARYMKTGEARIIGIGRDVIAQRADGSTVPVALAVSEVELAGDKRFFTGILHDLTERVEAERSLAEANQSLEARVEGRTEELRSLLVDYERSNRDLEEFAYVASHDLQAPLRNVRQGLELLNEHLARTIEVGFDDEALELQRLITAAVARMEELILGLLKLSRVDRNSSLPAERVDLDAVMDELMNLIAIDIAEAGATLDVGELPTVLGDRVQLRQALQNLIQNSLKYRHSDTDPNISITAAEDDTNWVVSVADNGIGIDPEQHERIFELFRRSHAGYDGVGLGLALTQRIVERHGGRIWVESTPGDGATFHITFRKPPPQT